MCQLVQIWHMRHNTKPISANRCFRVMPRSSDARPADTSPPSGGSMQLVRNFFFFLKGEFMSCTLGSDKQHHKLSWWNKTTGKKTVNDQLSQGDHCLFDVSILHLAEGRTLQKWHEIEILTGSEIVGRSCECGASAVNLWHNMLGVSKPQPGNQICPAGNL